MPKLIRTTKKSDMLKMCRQLLRDNELPVLSDSSLWRIMRQMPTISRKMLKGIDNFQVKKGKQHCCSSGPIFAIYRLMLAAASPF